jgi:hypothetical protein
MWKFVLTEKPMNVVRERLGKNKHVAQIQLGHLLLFPLAWAPLLSKMLTTTTTIPIMHQQMREAVFPRNPERRVSSIQVR